MGNIYLLIRRNTGQLLSVVLLNPNIYFIIFITRANVALSAVFQILNIPRSSAGLLITVQLLIRRVVRQRCKDDQSADLLRRYVM